MCVCLNVRVCVSIRMCVYVCAYTSICVNTWAFVCVCAHVCFCACFEEILSYLQEMYTFKSSSVQRHLLALHYSISHICIHVYIILLHVE